MGVAASSLTAIIGLLQGIFFIDTFRLNVWFAKRVGSRRIRQYMDAEDINKPANWRMEFQVVFLLIVGLVFGVCVILLIPGLAMGGALNALKLSPPARELQIRIWSWSLVIGLVGRILREQKRGRW